MPELPEVETVVRNLRPVLVNCEINNLTVLKAKIVGLNLNSQVINQKIIAVERLGKYIGRLV
jgi:formamidopyrimidine-DNA glycosylase